LLLLPVVGFEGAHGGLGNAEALNIVPDIVPGCGGVPWVTALDDSLLELEDYVVDQQLHVTGLHVDWLEQSLAHAVHFVLGNVSHLEYDLVLRDGVADVRVFLVTFEVEVDEDELALVNELELGIHSFGRVPIEKNLWLRLLLLRLEHLRALLVAEDSRR